LECRRRPRRRRRDDDDVDLDIDDILVKPLKVSTNAFENARNELMVMTKKKEINFE